jgi:hypothetical protein
MKKTKSAILLIKLAILCMLTFSIIYTPTASAFDCQGCMANCRTMYNECRTAWYCSVISCEASCFHERQECSGQCWDIMGCVSPPHAAPQSYPLQ